MKMYFIIFQIVVRDCKEIWGKMCDPKDRDVKITHDGMFSN